MVVLTFPMFGVQTFSPLEQYQWISRWFSEICLHFRNPYEKLKKKNTVNFQIDFLTLNHFYLL